MTAIISQNDTLIHDSRIQQTGGVVILHSPERIIMSCHIKRCKSGMEREGGKGEGYLFHKGEASL